NNAEALADWTLRLLVNRTDACGRYNPLCRRGQPRRDGRPGLVGNLYTDKTPLTRAKLVRHYSVTCPEDVVGLHSTSPANICRWGAFDVDRHDDDIDPDRTLAVALTLYCLALERGFRPLLTDSNGAGGYHMRLVFRAPVPSRDVYFLLRTMARQAGFA